MKPLDLLLIRHGEAVHNAVNRAYRQEGILPPTEHYELSDENVPLTDEGVRQARHLGSWLTAQHIHQSDTYLVSPFLRARQTADYLGISNAWQHEPLLRERSWGHYMNTPHNEREELLVSHGFSGQHNFHIPMPGGESMQEVVDTRTKPLIDTLHTRYGDGRIIAVSHGELIETMRFVIEQQSPEDWAAEKQAKQFIANASILEYKTEDDRLYRRMIVPHNPQLSWNDGEWVQI